MPDISKQRMTAEELRKARKASEEMGDIEFQMEIAPYTNYTDVIDPKISRYRGMKGLPGDVDVNLGGFYVQEEDPENPFNPDDLKPYKGNVRGVDFEIPIEPGTINAVHNKATPNIWAHEDRHKKNPGMSESSNRIADAALAITEDDWESAVKMWRDRQRRKRIQMTMSEAERDLIDELSSQAASSYGIANKLYDKELENGAVLPESEETWYAPDKRDYQRMRRDQAFWTGRKKELDEFDSWNEELEERNAERSQ